MANASEKMKKHALNKKWRFEDSKFDDNQFVKSDGISPKEGIKKIHVSNTATKDSVNDSMREIDSLKSIGKVSSFKDKINRGITSETHIDELKTIIESVDKEVSIDMPEILDKITVNIEESNPDEEESKPDEEKEFKPDIENPKNKVEPEPEPEPESNVDEEKPILFGEFPDINKSTQTEGGDEDKGEQEFIDGIEDVDEKDDDNGNDDDIINE